MEFIRSDAEFFRRKPLQTHTHTHTVDVESFPFFVPLLSVQSRSKWSSASNVGQLGSDEDHRLRWEQRQPVSLIIVNCEWCYWCNSRFILHLLAELETLFDFWCVYFVFGSYFLSTEGSARRRQLFRWFNAESSYHESICSEDIWQRFWTSVALLLRRFCVEKNT